ncbi:MAG: hypothetical protein WEB88_01040 [Gemmatimonadota bacterium]
MNAFQKWLLLGSSVATALTGIVYAWMKYLMTPTEPWAVINHPLEPWMLKAHIVVAPVMVFALGLIATGHIWAHFRSGLSVRRRTGITTMAVLVPMIFTGYLIQAVTHAGWLQAMVLGHLVTSALYVLGLGWHWLVAGGRSVRQERRPER